MNARPEERARKTRRGTFITDITIIYNPPCTKRNLWVGGSRRSRFRAQKVSEGIVMWVFCNCSKERRREECEQACFSVEFHVRFNSKMNHLLLCFVWEWQILTLLLFCLDRTFFFSLACLSLVPCQKINSPSAMAVDLIHFLCLLSHCSHSPRKTNSRAVFALFSPFHLLIFYVCLLLTIRLWHFFLWIRCIVLAIIYGFGFARHLPQCGLATSVN